MFETLTVTLREAIEAALVIGIILAYLGKTNKLALKKYVYAGIISAYVAKLGRKDLCRYIGVGIMGAIFASRAVVFNSLVKYRCEGK